jgi:hypothetical protein
LSIELIVHFDFCRKPIFYVASGVKSLGYGFEVRDSGNSATALFFRYSWKNTEAKRIEIVS